MSGAAPGERREGSRLDLRARLDELGRRHPRSTMLAVVVLAVVVTVVLLSYEQVPAVIYEGF